MFSPALLERAQHVIAACRAKGLHLAATESCTGGLILGCLTAIAGSSDVVERGFVVYTNFRSAKGRSLEADPRASLTFYWENLARQVRVRGDVERVSDAEADEYVATRPRGSQIGAWASDQSAVLVSREALLERAAEIGASHEGESLPRPAHWGGLRIVPHRVEFWQGMPDRLHDRFLYIRVGDEWQIERLHP